MCSQIPIFKCQYVKHSQGIEMDDYGFTSWLCAVTVTQVFYILDPKDEKKYIVVP
jgi:hypothetical protein